MKDFPNDTDILVEIQLEIQDAHDHSSDKAKQLRGKKRVIVAEEIMLKHGGNVMEAYYTAMSKEPSAPERVPNPTVFRQAKSDYRNKDAPSANWLENLMTAHDSFQAQKSNFISQLIIRPQLSFILSIGEQLDVLHKIKADDRIAHIDSTQWLVSIPKSKDRYAFNRIGNYFMLIKVEIKIIVFFIQWNTPGIFHCSFK